MPRKWTRQTAEEYVKVYEKSKDKGLKYWSAKDFLKNHRTMTPII